MKRLMQVWALTMSVVMGTSCVSSGGKSISSDGARGGVYSGSSGDSYLTQCGGKVTRVSAILTPIIRSMVAQRIPYTQAPANEWRDCSGNFLRLSSYLAKACPDQQAGLAAPSGVRDYRRRGKNRAPSGAKARTSRDLARWYKQQGRFTPIFYDGTRRVGQASAELKQKRNLIKVGAVLWFSRSAPKQSRGLPSLFGLINHVAVVSAVTKDSKGNVIRYEMYHGRNRGKLAAVTGQHFWDWPKAYLGRGQEYPPLGYWGQYLVGIGVLLPEPS